MQPMHKPGSAIEYYRKFDAREKEDIAAFFLFHFFILFYLKKKKCV
jgi:hypothetical protein